MTQESRSILSLNRILGWIALLEEINRDSLSNALIFLEILRTPIHTTCMILHQHVRFEYEHFLDFWYNSLMERKIFNSYESRLKLNFRFDSEYWYLRSNDVNHGSGVCCVNFSGKTLHNYYVNSFMFILPVCSIWWMSFNSLAWLKYESEDLPFRRIKNQV